MSIIWIIYLLFLYFAQSWYLVEKKRKIGYNNQVVIYNILKNTFYKNIIIQIAFLKNRLDG